MQSSVSTVKPDEQMPLQLLKKGFYHVLHYASDQCKDPHSLTYQMDELTNAMSHFQHNYAEIRTETWRQITYNQDTDA